MGKTDEQLWKEISNKRDEAQRHGRAVNEARAAVDGLNADIDAANAAIKCVEDFKNEDLKTLYACNDDVIKSLKELGEQPGQGIGDPDACSNVTDVIKGSEGILDDVDTQCDAIIARLKGKIDGWQRQRTVEQNRVDSESKAESSCLLAADSAQKQLSSGNGSLQPPLGGPSRGAFGRR